MAETKAPDAPAPPTCEVRLSNDKLALLVSMPDPHADLDAAATRVSMELSPLEMAEPPDLETLVRLLGEACEPGEHLADHVLIEGREPVPPRDATIEWQSEFFTEGFALNEDSGRLDYWERAEQRAVTENQDIAHLLLPIEGTPGLDLQGNEIAVPKPHNTRLRAGKGVRTEEREDMVIYFADVAGRISSKDGTVGVDNVYQIKGDVSLETGNIHHTGTVVISGDVREGATIEVDGDILIKGMVEPSTIVCGGNLVIGGGVLGDENSSLTVEGTVQARYLNDVTLRCKGDVSIVSQIDHSHVVTCGSVLVPRGRIAGGLVQAYKGLKVGQVGAAGATGTEIVIGTNWRFEEQREQRHARLVKLRETRDTLAAAVQRAATQGAFEDNRRIAVTKLQDKIKRIDSALTAEAEAQNNKATAVISGAVREMAVLESTWPGVTFHIGSNHVTSDHLYDTPRLIALRRDAVCILPMGEQNQPD